MKLFCNHKYVYSSTLTVVSRNMCGERLSKYDSIELNLFCEKCHKRKKIKYLKKSIDK